MRYLSIEAAQALAKQRETLHLNGLTRLSDCAAVALSLHAYGELQLLGLLSLSDVAAFALAMRSPLAIVHPKCAMSDAATKALVYDQSKREYPYGSEAWKLAAEMRAQMRSGEPACSRRIADGVKRCNFYPGEPTLDLSGIESLSKADAEDLAEAGLARIQLNDVETLTDDVAETLAGCGAGLEIGGLTTISDRAAQALARLDGDLSLNGLESLSDGVAAALSLHVGALALDGLASLTDRAAEALSRLQGDLSMQGLTSLSDQAAAALSRHRGELSLNEVTELSLAARDALARHEGVVSFWR